MYTAALSSWDSLQNWTKGYSGGRNGADIIKKLDYAERERTSHSQLQGHAIETGSLLIFVLFLQKEKRMEKRETKIESEIHLGSIGPTKTDS